jgi:hypothetical protein
MGDGKAAGEQQEEEGYVMADDNNGLALHREESTDRHLAVPSAKTFEPGSIAEAMQVARALVESRMFPNIRSAEAAFAVIATGREIGLSMMQSLRGIHVIESKPTLSADAMAGLVKSRRDVCKFFRMVESSEKLAVYETHRVGEPSPTRMQFSIEDAARAGVMGKDNWKKYPAAMLRARCITALVRAVYPDVLMGIYDRDELDDRQPVKAGPAVVYTSPQPAVELTPEETERALGVYYDCVSAAGNIGDLMLVFAESQRDDRLSESDRSLVKQACSTRRAVLEGRQTPGEGVEAAAQ